MKKIVEYIKRDIEHFGIGNTIYDLSFRTINRLVYFKILIGMKITAVNAEYLPANRQYRYQFLDKASLLRYCEDSAYELSREFLDEALAKGDECLAVLAGDTLASYGWYSRKPTKISDDLALHFLPDHVYMYKGFTHDSFRGQRLHAIGMTLALQEYLRRGYRGLISYVESNNFASLKSVYRMGYRNIGKIYIVRAGGNYYCTSTPGCRQYGFYVAPLSPLSSQSERNGVAVATD